MATKKKTEEAVETSIPEVENVAEAIVSDIENEQEDVLEKNSSVENNEAPSENFSEENTKEPEDTITANDGGFCVYIGPTIVGVIQKGSIFRGGKDEVLKNNFIVSKAIEKCPGIASLIVSGKTLSEDRIKISTPGNLLYENYMRLAKSK